MFFVDITDAADACIDLCGHLRSVEELKRVGDDVYNNIRLMAHAYMNMASSRIEQLDAALELKHLIILIKNDLKFVETSTKFREKPSIDLARAFHKAKKGKRSSRGEHAFELFSLEKVQGLRDSILDRTYRPLPSSRFEITDPKPREIFAADFPDRVVHHYVFEKTFPAYIERHLDYDSCSCRVDKGVLFAKRRLMHHIRSVTSNYKDSCVLVKLDIKSYFCSISRKKLLKILLWHLDRQFPNGGPLYETLKFLWKVIILDDPVPKMIDRSPKGQALVPAHKCLANQLPGVGLVIGNLTSQGGSNAFLNELDRYLRFELKLKHFVRYVDDLVIVLDCAERERVPEMIDKIDCFLCNELGLELNKNKTKVRDLRQGIDFLGDVAYSGHLVPGRRAVRNCRKAFREVFNGRKDPDHVACILGHFEHVNSRKALKRIFDELGWDFGEKRPPQPGSWSAKKREACQFKHRAVNNGKGSREKKGEFDPTTTPTF